MVLVVDDNAEILALVNEQLRSKGFEVATASNGLEAIDWCKAHGQPDLLLTDVRMPVLDGPALYRWIKERSPDVPVLFMSGAAGDVLREVDAPLLLKPFSFDELSAIISASLQAGPPGHDTRSLS